MSADPSCGTGRPDWIPAEGDLVRDTGNGRIGHVVDLVQIGACGIGLDLRTPGGQVRWNCPLERAEAAAQ